MRITAIVLSVAGMVVTAAMGAASAADDGLVARHSRVLDEVRTAPAAASYRKVSIAPVEVSYRKDWPRDANKIQSRRPSADDSRQMAEDMAAGLHKALEAAMRDRGYEVVPAPGPGVLVLHARLDDLQVNAPEAGTVPYTKTYVREAGEATLHLEGVDGATGQRVLVVNDHAKARFANRGVERATDVTTRFWFDEMFERWADGIAREMVASR